MHNARPHQKCKEQIKLLPILFHYWIKIILVNLYVLYMNWIKHAKIYIYNQGPYQYFACESKLTHSQINENIEWLA